MKKNFIIKKIEKSGEKTMYIFFNFTKGFGIKQMRTKNNKDSNIQIGEEVHIEGDTYILTQIMDFKKGIYKIMDGELEF